MTDKQIVNELHGTIINIFEYSLITFDGRRHKRKGIVIQPDNSNCQITSDLRFDRSQFSIGQRVVHVTYTYKRPATQADRFLYRHKKCPNEITEYEYVTYDELSYDQQQPSKKR